MSTFLKEPMDFDRLIIDAVSELGLTDSEVLQEVSKVMSSVSPNGDWRFNTPDIINLMHKNQAETKVLSFLKAYKQLENTYAKSNVVTSIYDRPFSVYCTPRVQSYYGNSLLILDGVHTHLDKWQRLIDLAELDPTDMRESEKRSIRYAIANFSGEESEVLRSVLKTVDVCIVKDAKCVTIPVNALTEDSCIPPYEFFKLYKHLPKMHTETADNMFEAVNSYVAEGIDVHEDVANYMKSIEDFIGVEYELVHEVSKDSDEIPKLTDDMRLAITQSYLNEHLHDYPKKVVTGKFIYNLGKPSLPVSSLNVLTDLTKKDKANVCLDVLASMQLPKEMLRSDLIKAIPEYSVPYKFQNVSTEVVKEVPIVNTKAEDELRIANSKLAELASRLSKMEEELAYAKTVNTQREKITKEEKVTPIHKACRYTTEAMRAAVERDSSFENRSKYVILQPMLILLMFASMDEVDNVISTFQRYLNDSVPETKKIIEDVINILKGL